MKIKKRYMEIKKCDDVDILLHMMTHDTWLYQNKPTFIKYEIYTDWTSTAAFYVSDGKKFCSVWRTRDEGLKSLKKTYLCALRYKNPRKQMRDY